MWANLFIFSFEETLRLLEGVQFVQGHRGY